MSRWAPSRCAEVLLVDAAEAADVAVLTHVGLRDPHARQALLEVGVDVGDARRAPGRRPTAERRRYHHVASEQRRQDGRGGQRERRRQDDEEHEHADAA